jgi:hypothetical protein
MSSTAKQTKVWPQVWRGKGCRAQRAVAGHLDEVECFGGLGEQKDAVAALVQARHEAVEQLPLGGDAHHLAVLLLLRPRVVQQVRVIAHLRATPHSPVQR